MSYPQGIELTSLTTGRGAYVTSFKWEEMKMSGKTALPVHSKLLEVNNINVESA